MTYVPVTPPAGVNDFAALVAYAKSLPADQHVSRSSGVTVRDSGGNTMDWHHDEMVHFAWYCLADPNGRAAAESAVCSVAAANLYRKVMKHGGAVVWRMEPDFMVGEHAVVERYDPDGPDKDYTTDRKCWMDRRFGLAKVRARMFFLNPGDVVVGDVVRAGR